MHKVDGRSVPRCRPSSRLGGRPAAHRFKIQRESTKSRPGLPFMLEHRPERRVRLNRDTLESARSGGVTGPGVARGVDGRAARGPVCGPWPTRPGKRQHAVDSTGASLETVSPVPDSSASSR